MFEYLSIVAALVAAVGAVAAAVVSGWVFHKGRLPEVVAYLARDDSGAAYNLVVENIGKGVAYDIRIDAKDLPIGQDGAEIFYHFESGIPMLTPGGKRTTCIWPAGVSAGEEAHNVTVRFSAKRGGRAFKCVYPLEFHTLQHELRTKGDLTLMRESLQRIATGR